MLISEKECILEVLSQVRNEIEEQISLGKTTELKEVHISEERGQAIGLEKAMKTVEAKEKEIRSLRTQRPPQNVDEIVKFTEMMELLRAGKKVAVKDRRYGSGKSSLIEYVYTNPQMNRMFAHLENGKEVDYNFSILDVWSAYGGEWKEPEMREVTLIFFKNYDDLHRKYYTTETQLVPAEYRVDEVVDYISEHITSYKGMDIIISFKPDDEIGYPCFISWKERKL